MFAKITQLKQEDQTKMMIFVILGALFLLALLFVPIYFFWVKEKANEVEKKANDAEQKDDGSSDL